MCNIHPHTRSPPSSHTALARTCSTGRYNLGLLACTEGHLTFRMDCIIKLYTKYTFKLYRFPEVLHISKCFLCHFHTLSSVCDNVSDTLNCYYLAPGNKNELTFTDKFKLQWLKRYVTHFKYSLKCLKLIHCLPHRRQSKALKEKKAV